jgi:hypothetical protein
MVQGANRRKNDFTVYAIKDTEDTETHRHQGDSISFLTNSGGAHRQQDDLISFVTKLMGRYKDNLVILLLIFQRRDSSFRENG